MLVTKEKKRKKKEMDGGLRDLRWLGERRKRRFLAKWRLADAGVTRLDQVLQWGGALGLRRVLRDGFALSGFFTEWKGLVNSFVSDDGITVDTVD